MINTVKRRELIIDQLCREVIAVVDASKFGRSSFCMIRGIGQIHRLVTDSRIPANYLHTLQNLGVEVINRRPINLRINRHLLGVNRLFFKELPS
ncbi:hypothetical protein SESI111939_21355 [Serratia silvae]